MGSSSMWAVSRSAHALHAAICAFDCTGDSHMGCTIAIASPLTPHCTLLTTLAQDGFTSRYLVLPFCLGHLASEAPRKFVLSAHSTMPLVTKTVPLPPEQVLYSQYCVASSRKPATATR